MCSTSPCWKSAHEWQYEDPLPPPNRSVRNNVQFHILRFIANCMLVASYLLSHSESPYFPQESEAKISPKLLVPALGASVGLGWMLHLSIAKVKKAKVINRILSTK